MVTPRRSVAGVCIAIVVLAAFLPGLGGLDGAWCEVRWLLLPDDVIVAVDRPVTRGDEQSTPLFSLLSSRGPPARLLV